MKNSSSKTSGLVAVFLIFIIAAVVWVQRIAIFDWWQLRNYSPPSSISALATHDTMTNMARHVFYVNHPDLDSNVADFHSKCAQNEQTIILGCYHPNQMGIDIFDVSDPRLSGVEEVTAAHEMLHAAYDRLSTKDKNYVNGLLLNYYNNQLKDQRILDTIASYKKTEPKDVVNEMHSVFGTEVGDLPQPLEDYYSRYFSDRSKVFSYASGYEGEFTNRSDQINAYDKQLASLKSQIDAQEHSLSTQSQKISADRAQLDQYRSNGQIEQYNNGVPGFNAEVAAYNAGVNGLHADIEQYNTLVSRRNDLAQELRNLDQAIDTRLTTQSVQ